MAAYLMPLSCAFKTGKCYFMCILPAVDPAVRPAWGKPCRPGDPTLLADSCSRAQLSHSPIPGSCTALCIPDGPRSIPPLDWELPEGLVRSGLVTTESPAPNRERYSGDAPHFQSCPLTHLSHSSSASSAVSVRCLASGVKLYQLCTGKASKAPSGHWVKM